uniref:Uncharacterized protein n=1 Tax=Meloidogyne javanica TaxID=6303 RepID=A0A915M5F3_MELJA
MRPINCDMYSFGEDYNEVQLEEQARKELIANTIQGLFGDDNIPTDVVPASQGYVHHDPSFYDGNKIMYLTMKVNNAIEESGREMPRGRGGPLIRDQGEQSAKGKEKVIEVSSDSD